MRVESSKFQSLSGVLLETAIEIARVTVARSRNEVEYGESLTQLASLLEQRTGHRSAPHPGFVKLGDIASDIAAQLSANRDNRIQDLLHERIDAERPSAGKTLEEFLTPSGES